MFHIFLKWIKTSKNWRTILLFTFKLWKTIILIFTWLSLVEIYKFLWVHKLNVWSFPVLFVQPEQIKRQDLTNWQHFELSNLQVQLVKATKWNIIWFTVMVRIKMLTIFVFIPGWNENLFHQRLEDHSIIRASFFEEDGVVVTFLAPRKRK